MNTKFATIYIALMLLFIPVSGFGLGQADIAVFDITVDNECYWTATMKNVGTTQLPVTATDQYYGSSIAMKLNNTNIGGTRFGQEVKMPGSVGYFTFKGSLNPEGQIKGTQTVEIEFLTNGSYNDINLANNKLSKTFTCTPSPVPKPDLAITLVDFTADCRPHIRVVNQGNAQLKDYMFTMIYLQRKLDNLGAGQLYLKQIDPAGQLKMPNGSAEWIDSADYKPEQVIEYSMTANSAIEDSNFNNNWASATLPDRCKASTTPVKISPTINRTLPQGINRDVIPQGKRPPLP
jgi:hypothetical protein